MRSKMIDLIMSTLHEKNPRELLHADRVSEIAVAIADKMLLKNDDVNQIGIAGRMHDIGKIGVDDFALNSKRKLNKEEWKEIQRHSEIGYRILISAVEFSEIATFVLEHHERWDGQGYPKGLKRENISVQARIIAVADSYDAMTRERTYKAILNKEEAAVEIQRCSGTQFDPAIVKIFLEQVLKDL
jgi:HD-GYP domain-containing protein (c-di-GMP phosphodiesterase class II)